jgi:nitrogen fixation/metabolism regulation signal transduction histidine kinase
MKIISHELMNSLTPIRSLSQNLLQIVDQDHETEDFEDIKSSISTIINRSDHLQFFVRIIESWLRYTKQKTNTNSFCLKLK